MAPKLKIRKGDTVEVIAGKDAGKRGTVLARASRPSSACVVERLNIVKRHTKPRPAPSGARGAAGHPGRRARAARRRCTSSNVALVSPACGKPTRVGYRFDATTAQGARRADAAASKDVELMSATEIATPAPARSATTTRSATRLKERFEYTASMAGAADRRRSRSTWASARRRPNASCSTRPPSSSRIDHRPAARDHAGQEVDRQLQAPRGHAHRLQGDAARRAHVRVPRPAADDRAAAHPRLPRHQPELVRRPRQLHARHPEQIIFPEIDYDTVDKVRGLDITFTTTAPTDEEARELLRELGMPFRES